MVLQDLAADGISSTEVFFELVSQYARQYVSMPERFQAQAISQDLAATISDLAATQRGGGGVGGGGGGGEFEDVVMCHQCVVEAEVQPAPAAPASSSSSSVQP